MWMTYEGYVTKKIVQTANHMYIHDRYVRYLRYVNGVMAQMLCSHSPCPQPTALPPRPTPPHI